MKERIHIMKKRIFSRSIGWYLLINLILTLMLNVFLELMERKSLKSLLLFIQERTFLFLFNGLIIFTTLSLVLLLRKKIFAYAACAGVWFLVGLANGAVLNNRKTPFTAVDLTIAKSALPIVRAYVSLPGIIGAVIAIVAVAAGFVCLFLYTPEQKRDFDSRAGAFWVLLIGAFFLVFLKVGTAKGVLARKFDNLITAYEDYGVAYGFFITAVDTGIDRPLNYSEASVKKIEKAVKKALKKKKAGEDPADSREPNIVFVQLESLFDPTTVKGLEVSEDPLPNIHRLMGEVSSGYLRVPVYGAGTINTEFEVITGMNLDHFGSGEFPFRSILHKRTCDSVGYWLEERDYESTVVHNNNASFYDRDKVYANLGFHNFVSIENMDVKERNESGWAKDYILKDNILDVLETTDKKDLIYAISVQAHGDYPNKEPEVERPIRVTSDTIDEKYLNAWSYYVNEIREMDDFIGQLLEELTAYPEDVMVIVYGDHLPGMNLESADIEGGTKYDTPYFIWDNFGFNKEHREEYSGKTEAWQLTSKILSQVHIHNGVLNPYHQTMMGTKKYRKNLRILEYDMLYGSEIVRRNKEPLLPADIRYGIHDPRIDEVIWDEATESYLLIGAYYTDQSRVYADNIRIPSEKLTNGKIRIPGKVLKKRADLMVCQVSVPNEKIIYNHSEPYPFDMESIDRGREEEAKSLRKW